jgi:hypothetical protein
MPLSFVSTEQRAAVGYVQVRNVGRFGRCEQAAR